MDHYHIFTNWLAFLDYAIVIGGAMVLTHQRFQEYSDAAGFGRLLTCFLGTLVAMAFTMAVMGLLLLKLFLLFIVMLPREVGGLAFIFGLLAPAFFLLLGAGCALIAGRAVTAMFFPSERSGEEKTTEKR